MTSMAPELERLESAIEAVRAIHQPCREFEQFVHVDGSGCSTCEESPEDLAVRPLLRIEQQDGARWHVHAVPEQDWVCIHDEHTWPCPTAAALSVAAS